MKSLPSPSGRGAGGEGIKVCATLARLPAPDLVGYVDDQRELRDLVLQGHGITGHRRGEAALRTQREALERHAPARLFDAADQRGASLENRCLGADKSEDHDLVFRCRCQRFESARAVRVVLQEERVHLDVIEQLSGNVVVAAFAEPAPLEVAPRVRSLIPSPLGGEGQGEGGDYAARSITKSKRACFTLPLLDTGSMVRLPRSPENRPNTPPSFVFPCR